METTSFQPKGNLKRTWEIFWNPEIIIRLKVFFAYNIAISIYYLYLVVIASLMGLYLPALYILMFSIATFLITIWASSFADKARQVYLIFSLVDFFIMSILSPGNLLILLSVIFRVWILGVNKRSTRFFH